LIKAFSLPVEFPLSYFHFTHYQFLYHYLISLSLFSLGKNNFPEFAAANG